MPASMIALLAVLVVVYLPCAVVLARTDLREHRLPNTWVAALTAGVATALALVAWLVPGLREDLRLAAVLALLLGAGAVLIALFAPPLLGMGDAKTVPAVTLMTAAFGGEALIAGALACAVIAGAAGTVVLLRTRRRGVRIAVGPVLLLAPVPGLLGAPLVAAALGTA